MLGSVASLPFQDMTEDNLSTLTGHTTPNSLPVSDSQVYSDKTL